MDSPKNIRQDYVKVRHQLRGKEDEPASSKHFKVGTIAIDLRTFFSLQNKLTLLNANFTRTRFGSVVFPLHCL